MTRDRPTYSLAIHTTSPQLGLAISNFVEDTRVQTWELGRDLSTQLHLLLTEFIPPQTWQDLAFIAVATGPGSFTGTRIGVVTARILAQQLDIPLFAISSLAAVAKSAARSAIIAVEMPAQRNQLFTAIYEVNGEGFTPVLSDRAIAPDDWQQTLNSWATSYQLIKAPTNLGTSVSSLLELAYLDWQKGKRPSWENALPFYGQHPVILN